LNVNFSASVTLDRVGGKFVPKDEIADEIQNEIDGAVGCFSFDNGEGSYEVTEYSVEVVA